MEESAKCLHNAIEPFEACFAKASDPAVKEAAATYLKQIYFLLRNEKPEYQAAYEKYNDIVSNK